MAGFCQVPLKEVTSVLMGTSQPRLLPHLPLFWTSAVGIMVGTHHAPTLKFLEDAQAFLVGEQRKNVYDEPTVLQRVL